MRDSCGLGPQVLMAGDAQNGSNMGHTRPGIFYIKIVSSISSPSIHRAIGDMKGEHANQFRHLQIEARALHT